jgi:hypothetical protein
LLLKIKPSPRGGMNDIYSEEKSLKTFTYGDTFPTFTPNITDNLEYRNTVFTYDEILKIIAQYGMPQEKRGEPVFAQPCYVEAQVWSDTPAIQYKKAWR